MTNEFVLRPKTHKGHPQTNPNSLANLIPYKKGQNGHGRVYPLKEQLYHLLDKAYTSLSEADKAKLKVGEVLALETIKGAIALNPTAFNQVWDRVEGKVPGDIPAGFQDNRTINIIVSSEKAKELTKSVAQRLLSPKE